MQLLTLVLWTGGGWGAAASSPHTGRLPPDSNSQMRGSYIFIYIYIYIYILYICTGTTITSVLFYTVMLMVSAATLVFFSMDIM
jgi:hypothetical protein